jgi:ABC-type multidrug transport system ATPase subunit
LDPLIREEFLEGVNRLIGIRPRTVLFSSHIMSDIEKVADMIGIVNEGRLLVCAGRDALMEKTKRLKVSLKPGSDTFSPPRDAVLADSDGRCWNLTVYDLPEREVERIRADDRVEQMDVQPLSLEEIFKDFIKGARRAE